MTSPDRTAALVMDTIPLLMRLLRTKFREKRAGDLSMAQFRTLAYVNAQEGACLSEASGHIGLGLPSMSKLVESLVQRGLLERTVHGQDRRRVCLTLTQRGRRELKEAYTYTQSFFAQKFAELPEVERARVAGAMEVLQTLFDLNPRPSPREAREALSNPNLP